MAGPKQVVYTPVDVEDADYTNYEVDAKMEAENEEFEQFKSEMHDAQFEAKITVGKKLTDSAGRPMGRQVFECFECGVEDYTFSQICNRIREDFGTGLYQIRGRDSKGKFKFNKTVGILAPNTPDNKPAGQDVGALIDKFSDAMQRQQMQTEQMLLKMAGPQHGGDAFDQMTKMMAAMGTMMGAMGINPQTQQAPKTLVEQLTEFKMIKELFGENDSDGEGGEANLYTLLGKTIEHMGGPIAAALASGAEKGELTPDGLATTASLPAPEPETDKHKEAEMHKVEMRKNIHILIQNAKTKIPPEAFAQILVNNTPADKEDQLWDFISDENCVKTIIELEPAAEAYKEWFEKLREAVIEIMSEPEPDAETEGLQDDEYGASIPNTNAVAGADSGNATEETPASEQNDSDSASDT